MQELQTEIKTIRVHKKDKTFFDLTQSEFEKFEKMLSWTDPLIKLIDSKWHIIFFWNKNLITEITNTMDHYRNKNSLEEDKKRTEYEKWYYENKKKKDEWTNNKLKEIWDDFNFYIEETKKILSNTIQKEYILLKFIKDYALCLMRKTEKCPYK